MQLQRITSLLIASVCISLFSLIGCSSETNINPKTSSESNNQAQQSDTEDTESSDKEPDVVYVPTPYAVVEKMLELANVSEDDVVYDLGSGDGRIPIKAAQDYEARGVGIEIDPELVQEARRNAQEAGVNDQVEFIQQDLFETDLSEATVITLYLLPSLNVKLRPKLLQELEPGTPIVSHDFRMGEWEPDRVVEVEGSQVYLWIVPEEIPENLR
ncbi:MAG: class I SAM-dependent methyltransferase [Halothece sp. Uz-M2-17]|nr:class I SAM-dependent methyltransferase [Halothece sp. Uz-M2-17]